MANDPNEMIKVKGGPIGLSVLRRLSVHDATIRAQAVRDAKAQRASTASRVERLDDK